VAVAGADSIAALSGEDGALLRRLARQLALAVDLRYALVGRVDSTASRLESLALCADGSFADVTLELAGSPCRNVADGQLCVYPSGVRRLFPHDELLARMGIEGYAGVPLCDAAGRPTGIACVFDTEQIDAATTVHRLREFAARAGSELDRLDAQRALRESERREIEAQASLRRRDAILAAVAEAAELLLASAHWDEAAPEVLELLGRAAGASRAYVFQSRYDGERRLRSSMAGEWVAPGIAPTIDVPFWRDYLEPTFEAERLARGEAIVYPTAEAPDEMRAVLTAEGTLTSMSVPILVDGRLWGYVGFDDCEHERAWTVAETEALRAAAGTLGAAIGQADAAGELAARERILNAVAAAAELLLRAPSWRDAIDEVLRLLGQAGSASRCWLFECREIDGRMHSTLTHEWVAPGVEPSQVAAFWRDRIEPQHVVAELSRGLPTQALREEVHPEAQARLAAEGTQSIICVPVLLEGRLAAYVGYDDCDAPRRWSSSEEEALRAAASVLGSAMQQERSLATIRARERILAAIAAAAQRVLSAPTTRDAVDIVLGEIGQAAGVSRVFVVEFEHHEDGSATVVDASQWNAEGFAPTPRSVWEGQVVPREPLEAYERGDVVQWLTRDTEGQLRAVLEASGTLSLLYVPLAVRGSVWGLVGFNDCAAERTWDVAEIEALRAAAGAVSALIERGLADEALRASDEQLWQARKMEAVGRLAGGVAHDLNNYLTAIVGYAEFVREKLPPEERADADELLAATDRVGELVRRLLTFSRPRDLPDAGGVDGGEVLRGIEGIVRALAGDGVQVEIEVAPGLRPVAVERDQLERVVVNLAVNARDAMPRGGTLSLGVRPEDGGLRLEVADTGVGMDEATRARALEPFFTTKGSRGTGLGLATVYGIVNRHGGRLQLESAPGAGTRAVVWLPGAS
jgi:signal transduction histidine kinase